MAYRAGLPVDGTIVPAPHVDCSCVITLAENEATALRDLLTKLSWYLRSTADHDMRALKWPLCVSSEV